MSISHFVIEYNVINCKDETREEQRMRLKDIREDRDMTQKKIAEYLHIRQNTYSQYETGQRQLPIDVLVKLADFFGTSADYILGITDESKPYPRARERT